MVQKVLLIDDDAEDRELFCEAFEEIDRSFVCYTEADGRKALAKLNNKEIKLPDVIFLDINMPITGWDCLSKLKEHKVYKNIPVIMYSTSSSELDIDKAQKQGAICLFTKPYNYKELKNSLEILITYINNGLLSAETLKAFRICN